MKTTKRILSMLLCMALVLGMIPVFASAAEETVLATFTMPEKTGASGWNDGTEIKSTNIVSYENNGYTLTFDSYTKVYQSAYDATGLGFIKFGTSSKTGSLTFTVPDDVTRVEIKLASYKGNQAKYSVNGTTGSITEVGTSNTAGSPVVVSVDTSSEKTVTVASASGGVRMVMLAVIFYGSAAGGEEGGDTACEHANLGEATHENGAHEAVCPDCEQAVNPNNDTVSVTYTDAGHTVTCTCNYNSGEVAHTMPETWTVETAATYDAPGLEKRTCTYPGCEYTEEQEIPQKTVTGDTYIKYTETTLVTGTYIMVTAKGYAPGVLDGNWVTAVQPLVLSEDKVASDLGGVWTLTVVGNTVIMKDANGVTVVGGNKTIASGDGSWLWGYDTDNAAFYFTTEDGNYYLMSNHSSSYQFRAYADKTGNSSYSQLFTLYKLEGEAAACEHEATYNKTETKHTQVCSKCNEALGSEVYHDILGENGVCSDCGYAVDTTVLFPAILEEAYALESGASMSGSVTLTGVITNIGYYASSSTGTATVDIVVNGDTARPMNVYKLASGADTDVSALKVGDTITVTGPVMNYNGKKEFNGATLNAHVPHECQYSYVANGTLGHYQQCSICSGTTATEPHTDADADGACDVCGTTELCTHDWVTTHNGAHVETCSLCSAVKPTEYVISEEKDEAGHWTECSCGVTVVEKTAHTYTDHKCSCGYVEPLNLSGYFNKVDISAGISAGYYVIAGTADKAVNDIKYQFMTGESDGKNRQKGTSLTINCITAKTEDQSMVWEFIAVDGGFKIRNAGTLQYLYYDATATENLIHLTDSADAAGIWNVFCNDNGVWTLQVAVTSGETTTYRELSAVTLGSGTYIGFATYGTAYRAIDLYKVDDAESTHTYTEEITTPATCTTAGVKTYTCTLCGDSYTEEIVTLPHTEGDAVKENIKEATCGAAGSYELNVYCTECGAFISGYPVTVDPTGEHNYVDGKCTVCGAEEPVTGPVEDAGLKYWSKSISFEQYIGLQFIMDPDVYGAYDSVYVETVKVNYKGEATEGKLEAVPYYGYFVFNMPVDALSMTDEITLVLYAEKDGVTYVGEKVVTSVEGTATGAFATYAKAPKVLTALVDMLNFGAEVQKVFAPENTNLPNANLGEYASYATTTEPVIEDDVRVEGSGAIAPMFKALNIEAKVEYQMIFAKDMSAYEAHVTIGTQQTQVIDGATFVPYSGYYAMVIAFEPVYMRDQITITFHDKATQEQVSASYIGSVEGYAAGKLATLPGIVTAMMRYSDAVVTAVG